MDFEVLAEGLLFPEGPIAMPDDSVVLVEIARGTLTRVWNGRTEVIANLGGGPNGAAIGPDGAVYVCNNGGLDWREVNGVLDPSLLRRRRYARCLHHAVGNRQAGQSTLAAPGFEAEFLVGHAVVGL